jgi:hypothetical protein
MEFRQCSIAGLKHMEQEGDLFAAQDNSGRYYDPVLHFAVRLLTITTIIC